ncbi:hypothetical protein K501DRAFT_288657 [Backusella circina FSU 941]|nr:hypothetical protein K501DRAFT_288657 [Backusella circina FSU 941]
MSKDFKNLCYNIAQHEAHHIPSPPHQKRRAAVAAILRWYNVDAKESTPVNSLDEFFTQDWVKKGEPQLLFMQRATRVGDRWSGHCAFPGGKNEPGETDEDTVKREVLEEIGLDLNTPNFIRLGYLDSRELSSTINDKLLMILVPFVFLQVVHETPTLHLQESEVADAQWIPLSFFLSNQVYPSRPVTEYLSVIQIRAKWTGWFTRLMLGSVTFPSVDLPCHSETRFRLWGLTMRMTRDLVEFSRKENLGFIKLTEKSPEYSRPDIGWLVKLIARMTLKSNTRAGWDKAYFRSIRKAVLIAALLRLVFSGVTLSVISAKLLQWHKKRLV